MFSNDKDGAFTNSTTAVFQKLQGVFDSNRGMQHENTSEKAKENNAKESYHSPSFNDNGNSCSSVAHEESGNQNSNYMQEEYFLNTKEASGEMSSAGSILSENSSSDDDEFVIGSIPDFEKQGSLMDRLHQEDTIVIGNLHEGIDNIGTAIYRGITRAIISISPLMIVIGAFFLIFARGRATSYLLMFGAAMFLILFAPEIVKMVLGLIFGVFN